MGQGKEIKQNWKESNNFDICISVIFSCYDKSYFQKGNSIAGYTFNHLWDFPDISKFSKMFSLKGALSSLRQFLAT